MKVVSLGYFFVFWYVPASRKIMKNAKLIKLNFFYKKICKLDGTFVKLNNFLAKNMKIVSIGYFFVFCDVPALR